MARVYVAAPYEDAHEVRRVHGLLAVRGHAFTSDWAESAVGKDDLSLPAERLEILAGENDSRIGQSDAMIVLAREGAGGEMFCELRWALLCGLHVYWLGDRRILSTFRRGVTTCASIDEVLDRIAAGSEVQE